MPLRPLSLLFSLGLGVVPLAANSDPLLSADSFLQRCQQQSATEQSFCQGYIAGTADADAICVPADIAFSTLVDLVTNSLQNAKNTATTSAATLIVARLTQVFPCSDEAADAPKRKNWSNKERLGK
jgi:hypothetical protein